MIWHINIEIHHIFHGTNQWIWRPNAVAQSSALPVWSTPGTSEPMSLWNGVVPPGSVEFLRGGSLDEYRVSIN